MTEAWRPSGALTLNDGALAECTHCGQLVPAPEVQVRPMNTAYVDVESNYMDSCLDCYEWSEVCWAAQWAEYHAGCL